jgi:peptidyl-prolyl cis-trans isomerase C
MENKILATVGGTPITEGEVTEFILSLGQRGQGYNTPDGRRAVLNQLIESKLILLDAKRNLMEGEAEFRAQLAKIKDRLLVNYAAEKIITSTPAPKEDEISTYYKENAEKFVNPETVNASHILVDTEKKALAVYEEISSGAKSFEDAAKEYSSCPSKANGGSLGDFGRGQMVPEFDTAVFEMEVGTVTATPVKTQFGYHLIKLNSKTESTTASYEEVKDTIKAALTQEKQQKAFESKINQLKIMYPVDIL